MFGGIYTPIVTPFKEDESIDFEKLKYNLDIWGKTDLDGIVVLGSNGEFVYLSHEEKLEVVKFVIDNFNEEKNIIVGTYCESTIETIKLTKEMAKLGADAALVLPPNYYRGGMNEEILYDHFVDVADESSIPVMIYNMPGNTGINLSSKLIARLSKHPNIVGIKDTAGNIVQLSETVRDTDEDFAVFAGNAGYLLPAFTVGARGATLALANILPDDCCKLVNLFKEGKIDEARKLQLKMIEINYLVTGGMGISGLKYALDLLGFQGGVVRRPLKPLTEEKKSIIKDALVKYGALQE
ncbi:MAG: 4-hydroxy-tetrahydrodipicolinate synthase [Gudongella sp.]|nr:4-hydroxy-tetrahydrodipicolinate synthase [Gudongella sp.]